MEPCLTVTEAAAIIGVSANHVRALIAQKALRATNVGRGKKLARWRITHAEIEDFLGRRQVQEPTTRRRRQEPKDYVEYV